MTTSPVRFPRFSTAVHKPRCPASDLVRGILSDGPVRADERLLTFDDLHVLVDKPMSQVELGRRLGERVRAGVRVLV